MPSRHFARLASIPDQQTKQAYFYYGSDLVFHVPARAAGKGDGGDGEEITIHGRDKGLPRGWSGYIERRAKPQRHVVSDLVI